MCAPTAVLGSLTTAVLRCGRSTKHPARSTSTAAVSKARLTLKATQEKEKPRACPAFRNKQYQPSTAEGWAWAASRRGHFCVTTVPTLRQGFPARQGTPLRTPETNVMSEKERKTELVRHFFQSISATVRPRALSNSTGPTSRPLSLGILLLSAALHRMRCPL